MIIENDFDCTVCGGMFVLNHDNKLDAPTTCPDCAGETLKIAYVKCAVYHNRYSPMHPKRSRGMGGVRDAELTWAQKQRIEKQEKLREAWLDGN
jgi:hypothetical protein